MICPFCKHKQTRVVDKRESKLQLTRRRRECLKCKKRFTTYERIEAIPLIIIKKDNAREHFNREKLMSGILKACEKRPVSSDMIQNMVDEIENEARNQKSSEVESSFIGELVMKKLKDLDKVAYIRFASVYRQFADLSSFEKELKDLIKK
ncbi:transcriptional regulator NrdR [Candidatus Woesearchaeota archaeon]|nr:transcriptional regulator NrdR [Candidatus Woesearchaeota archaeon]